MTEVPAVVVLERLKPRPGPKCGRERRGFICTRSRRHRGPHVAHDSIDTPIALWWSP